MKMWTFHIDKSEQIEDDYIEIKVEKSESVKGLSFKYNQFIRYAPINVRQVFPNLIGYEALRNSLLKIGYVNFEGLFELQMIHLGQNYISKIPIDTFKDAKELKFLYLNGNRIQTLDGNPESTSRIIETKSYARKISRRL
ncbi:hypothetical protein ACKWTF_010180 [Chironomus riparius]